MKRAKLIRARARRNWTLAQAAELLGCTPNTLNRWELGKINPGAFSRERLCDVYGASLEDLGLVNEDEQPDVVLSSAKGDTIPSINLSLDDPLSSYARGVAACIDLYFNGNPHHAETILPLLGQQISTLLLDAPNMPGLQIASHASRLSCDLAADREDFNIAQQMGQQAFVYAQMAQDLNLQIASLISLSNSSFHRKLSTAALQPLLRASSLLSKDVTPLLKGRTYAGLAEVYAMRGQLQESMRALGLAYDTYPDSPESDAAYPYLRASHYSLYMFGDAQSRLFLGQPDEAEKALKRVQDENADSEKEPITKLDLLYYQAEVQTQRDELEASEKVFTDAALLAKQLGSKLYFNKLASRYYELRRKHPQELATLEEVFQPW